MSPPDTGNLLPASGARTPIVLVGGQGMLGSAWRRLLDDRGLAYTAPPRGQLDLTDPAAVQCHLPPGTALVINCAAYTNVDAAESDEDQATAVNGHGPGVLARRCADLDATLVHYSTDYVFAGHATSPYPVNAPIAPPGAYGRSKAVGEAAIRDAGGPHLILRTSWLYAPWGNNFVRTMLRLTAEKDQLRVVHDQTGRPTSAPHLAEASLRLLEAGAGRPAGQTFHVTDGGQCTWCEFTREIARLAGPPSSNCDIQPCTTADFPRPAPRPAYSVLDLTTTETLIGPMPAWQSNLAAVLTGLLDTRKDQQD